MSPMIWSLSYLLVVLPSLAAGFISLPSITFPFQHHQSCSYLAQAIANQDGTDEFSSLWLSNVNSNDLYPSTRPEVKEYLDSLRFKKHNYPTLDNDPLWEQVKLEATAALGANAEAGPLLYTGILSQSTLKEAIVGVISHAIGTELIPATAVKNLFLEQLTPDDWRSIACDLVAASTRSASIESAMSAVLFHQGFQALVCHRLGHRLWKAGRTGLAYFMQSTVSRIYAADIHPAATLGVGIHLRATPGVVIGETAVLGNDVSVLGGVTLGGTGKESGDRHPKLGNGVTVQHGATVLGNIRIGEGAIIASKSIVTKPVPPLSIVSGVPATLQRYRTLTAEEFQSDMQRHLAAKYLPRWKKLMAEADDATSIEAKPNAAESKAQTHAVKKWSVQ